MIRRPLRGAARSGRASLVLALIVGFLLACAPQVGSDPGAWRVLEVVDGDTVRVERGGERVLVRLVGIDAPEKRHPQRLPEYLADEARARLSELVSGRTVDLVRNALGDEVDRYGRRLAYLQIEGQGDPAELLLEEGLVRVFDRFPHQRLERYRDLERAARERGKGLWSEGGLAELRWRLEGRSPGIEVVPVGGADFGVVYDGYGVSGLGGEGLIDALWAARRAAAMKARGEEREARQALRKAGFRPLR